MSSIRAPQILNLVINGGHMYINAYVFQRNNISHKPPYNFKKNEIFVEYRSMSEI
jgi:hypothetical protein